MRAWFDERYPVADVGWRELVVSDRYVDTSDHRLARAGHGARLRRSGGRTTVGLKTDISVAGARHRRRELEGEATSSLDPRGWPPSAARDLVTTLAGEAPLLERFTLRQKRCERVIEAAGATLLVSLDDARVLAGGRTVGRLRGVEVELRAGRRRGLREVESQLVDTAIVAAQPLSKMQLAHGLVAARTPLAADDAFAEAGRKVLAGHLARMLDRAQPARRGDRLALKQMRVATRRMRSVWRVFGGVYRRSERRRHVAELRSLARRLGDVRDLDVLLERLPADKRGLRPLAEAWRAERHAAMEELLAHLDSADYAALVTDHRRFVGTPAAGTVRRDADLRVNELAGTRLGLAYQHLTDFGPSLSGADETTLHALRISAKRLRYTLETFAGLLPAEPYRRLHEPLVALQDELGALNDAAVAAARAAAWLAAAGDRTPPSVQASVNAYIAAERTAVTRHRRAATRRWRAVAGAAFRRDMTSLTNR